MLKATAEKEQNDKLQKKANAKKDGEFKTEETEFIDPIKLEKTEDPLQDVVRFLNPVKIYGENSEEIHMLTFEVYYRKGKLLLQLLCLKRAYRICSPNSPFYPLLLGQTSLFLNYLISLKEQLNESIRAVLLQELPTIEVFNLKKQLKGDSHDIFTELPTVEQFIGQHLPPDSESFLIRVEHIKVKNLLSRFDHSMPNATNSLPNGKSESVVMASAEIQTTLSRLIVDLVKLSGLSLESCADFFNSVNNQEFGLLPNDEVENLRETLHSLYPFASCFMNEKQLELLENELSASDYFTAEPEEYNCNVNDEN